MSETSDQGEEVGLLIAAKVKLSSDLFIVLLLINTLSNRRLLSNQSNMLPPKQLVVPT